MKKVLSKALAGVLGIAMLASMAYVPDVTSSDEYQLRLDSVKAVNVQTAITGVRAYSDLLDTTAGYQVNDPIYIATTVSVLNLEKSKYQNLQSIDEKDIPVVIGSPSVDLSLAKYSNPIILSHIYSNVNETPIGTVSSTIPISGVVDYDSSKNEVKLTFRGYEQNAVTWLTGFSTTDYNKLYLTAAVQNDKIMIPALRARDGKTTVYLGATSYQYDWTAPEAMSYTVVLQGITKDNAGAAKGDLYAKIQVSGAEKFVKKYEYYVNNQGTAFKDLKVEFGSDAEPVEYVDYVKVPVSVLEIKDAYDVVKYDVKASGMIFAPAEIVYDGDNKDYLNSDKSGKVLARVNPNLYDNTSKKSFGGSNTAVNVAGGVNSTKTKKAIVDYKYDSKTKTFTNIVYDTVPLTSVVYTNNYTVWAPAYYGISTASGNATPKTAHVSKIELVDQTITEQRTVVDYYEFVGLQFDAVPNTNNFAVTVIDRSTGKLVAGYAQDGSANGSGTPQYSVTWVPTSTDGKTGNLQIKPISDTVYPTSSTGSTTNQSWYLHLGIPLKGYKDAAASGLSTYKATASSTSSDTVVAISTSETGGANTGNKQMNYAQVYQTGQTVDAIYIPSTVRPATNFVIGSIEATPSTLSGVAITTTGVNDAKKDAYYANLTTAAQASLTTITGTANPFQYAPYMGGSTADSYGQLNWANIPSSAFARATLVGGPVSSDAAEPSFVEHKKTLKVSAPVKQLKLSLVDFWTRTNTTEYPSGNAVIPGNIPGFNLTNVYGNWTVNQQWRAQGSPVADWAAGTGAANDATDLANATVGKDAIYVTLTGRTNLNNWATDSLAGNQTSTDFQSYSAAFVTDKTHYYALNGAVSTGSSAGLQLLSGPFNSTMTLATTSTVLPLESVGWAQNQSMPKTVFYDTSSSTSSSVTNTARGLPNAHITINYNTVLNNMYIQREDPMSAHLAIADDKAHNGISTYVIQYNKTSQPIIAIATEMTYYDSTHASSVAFFDAYNQAHLAQRVLRSQDTTLTYAEDAGYVNDSEKLISAVRYFGLDTSFTTGYKVTEDTFEAKGAPAVYSKELTNQFAYGTLTLYDEEVDEGTDPTEVTDAPEETEAVVTDTPEETPEATEAVETETPEPVADVTDAPATAAPSSTTAPKTGDASASTAIALATTAIVAAAGLVFVMKKSRR